MIGHDTTRQYGREDVSYENWYSSWMKQLARIHTRVEIEHRLGIAVVDGAKAAAAHLRAIQATNSMEGQSQRRAQARNVAAATGDERIALSGALEIHELFPEHAKPARCDAGDHPPRLALPAI